MTHADIMGNTSTVVTENDEADLRDYMEIISRHKWSILGLSIVLGLLAAITVFSMEPVYRAAATLLIDPQKKQIVSIEEVYDLPDLSEEYLETQTQILQSRELIKQVIYGNNLSSHREFSLEEQTSWLQQMLAGWQSGTADPISAQDRENQVIDIFRDKLRVGAVTDSQLIEISFDAHDPELASAVPNLLANSYIQRSLGTRMAMTEEAVGWISEGLDELRIKLTESEKALQDYRDSENLVDVGGVDSIAAKELDEITRNLVEAKRNLAEAKTLLGQVTVLRGLPASAYGSIPAVLSDPGVLAAKETQARVQSKVTELSGRYGPSHPVMIAARSELDEANQNLISQINNVIASVSKQYEVASAKVRQLTTALSATKGDVAEINRKQAKLHALQRDVDNNRELYDIFVNRLKETNVTSDMQSANATIVDPATVPSLPVKPNKPLIIAIAFLLGIVGGTFMAFLTESLDNSLKYTTDIERKLHMPVLGVIPKLPARLIGGKLQSLRYYTSHIESAFAENIRTVRTNLMLANANEKKRIIVVTSSIPMEGKSTVAVNLALSLAQLGKTVLIDMDFRRPIVAKIFKLKRRHAVGLSDFISGTHSLDRCINFFEDTDLSVMTAGTVSAFPLEMVASDRFKQGLEILKKKYEYIVIDSPPVIPVSDAIILSGIANAVVYIAKANDTPWQLAQDGIRQLKQVGAPLVGVILNQVTFSGKPGRYGSYLSDYYKTYGYSAS